MVPVHCVTSTPTRKILCPYAVARRCGLALQRDERSVRRRMAVASIVEGYDKSPGSSKKKSMMTQWQIERGDSNRAGNKRPHT